MCLVKVRQKLRNHFDEGKDNVEKIKPLENSDNIIERHRQKKRQNAKENCLKYLEMKEKNLQMKFQKFQACLYLKTPNQQCDYL